MNKHHSSSAGTKDPLQLQKHQNTDGMFGTNRGSDPHVGVHLPQSVADGGQVAAQVLHHVLDAAGVFEQVHALSVRVVVHRERALDRLRELPVTHEVQAESG